MKKKCPSTDRRLKGERTTQDAQGLVEFAIILPVILLTLFVLVELARLLHAWLAIENGARAGVRYAVTAEYDPNHCPVAGCETKEDEYQARVASIHDAAWAGSSSIVRVGWEDAEPDEKSYFNVVVCDPEKIVAPASTFGTYSCPEGEDPGEPGERVVVVVEFNHPLLAPLLTSVWPQLRLDASRAAQVETYRIPLPVGTAPAYNSPTPRPTNTPIPTVTPGNPKPPDCDFVHFGLTGNASEHWVKAYVTGYEMDDDPPGAIYAMYVTQVNVGHGEGPSPTLKTFTWETWGEDPKEVTINESGYFIYTPPDPGFHVAHCYPDGCSDVHFKGTLLANFDGPLTELTSMRLQVEFPAFPDVVCHNWVSYEGPGYVPDTPAPYETNTPNPNPPTKTPTIEWSPPTPTWTEDLGGPSD